MSHSTLKGDPVARSVGIHHVSAITSHAQRNLDFYVGFLGLRLVKQAVNFEDPDVYHLFYGDEMDSPGSVMTFFVWPGSHHGQQGMSQVAVTSFTDVSGVSGSIDCFSTEFASKGLRGDHLPDQGRNQCSRFAIQTVCCWK